MHSQFRSCLLTVALVVFMGIMVSRSISEPLAHLRQNMNAIIAGDYDRRVRKKFERYLTARRQFYLMEGRWPGSTFWRRRQQEGA